ncbi:uncharacterized protein LOC143230958 [Tachypleus tridentatus]|uniref:uncharacterized protein LOC143230958 n=1 Tax=Tachypleus tridentatus TaxID=6853 RepID=UPI003FD46FED
MPKQDADLSRGTNTICCSKSSNCKHKKPLNKSANIIGKLHPECSYLAVTDTPEQDGLHHCVVVVEESTEEDSEPSDSCTISSVNVVSQEAFEETGVEAETVFLPETVHRDYHAPIVGYEVMERRARFTVFRICVKHLTTGSNWFVFRRYTDFVRLNRKLKVLFPGLRFSLPPKRWFGNNFDPLFLEDRLLGLQAYTVSIISHPEISKCKPVREFFCIDEPPSPYESIEESKALCESLEETVYKLRQKLREKDMEVSCLHEEIRMLCIEQEHLLKALKPLPRPLSKGHLPSKTPSFKDIPERVSGDGCILQEERPSPLGGAAEHIEILEDVLSNKAMDDKSGGEFKNSCTVLENTEKIETKSWEP